ncbi:Meiotically up-regulated gene 69 protein [Taphrina deformans PYCC 5710]|uniref:Meiotically up-regulated gene 69 protein n=1 Tax=Taphrina deformans (strain PYCC 5710 / ATCC 11124 / CBS 356.35 / IMI 108563 / JCM 9778 / NBRC 8474) TaxID=1097556 RepID=R4XB83_TAPDE|nr:Meiotically up-regulated gene 69 protein [Taphrina deformans PYCC 5710]|eukprot:CCG82865.1 Meiotically up-regulated gene 69 protein [Taphrina deformans PYCC 5710]
MARQAEKQLAKSNVAKITLLRNLAIGVNAVFVLIRLIWCYKSTSKKTWFMYVATNIVASLVHSQLVTMGSPRYAADGSLKSSGEDLGQAGLTEYLTDLVYITWIIYILVKVVQLTSSTH